MYNSNLTISVKEIIKEQGLKQCVVAKRAGFSERKFSDMLNGRYIAKADDIPAICSALGITPNELFKCNSNPA